MKKAVKITAIVLASLIGLFILIVVGYVIYVAAQYYRIDDNTALDVCGTVNEKVSYDTDYTLTTYNLGFGSYSPEYSFFMDTGVMNDGKKVAGKYAKGMNKDDVRKNINGQISLAKEKKSDFYFFQEVDEKADRSYKINMREEMTDALLNYCSTYALNFHTANLIYPFSDPIGKSVSGILTLSRYRIESSVRRSFPITSSFPDKFFDLDRCFSLNYIPIEGSENYLTLLNLHMSAYDEGGKIRAKQLEMLNGTLASEYAKGNYVIAGGDFNHCLIADDFDSDEQALNYFESKQQVPDWVKNSILHESEIAEGFKIVAPKNAATCRGADIPYEKDVNYSTVIDGFIVSDNIEVVKFETIDTEYAYSDHNPVTVQFKLKTI
ncbi:MAG: endonuclease [Clostridia bacterium]|nr:endonuclease [Clostridia bacterium]